MSAYLQCDRCGDDSDKYIAFILYDCSECRKKNICGSCMKWFCEDENIETYKPVCGICDEKNRFAMYI